MNRSFQVIIGSILGDGCLRKLSPTTQTSSLLISQHFSKVSYLEWLNNEIGKNFEVGSVKPKNGYKKGQEQFYFETKRNRILGDLRKSFYPNGIKSIPLDIKDYLNQPITLAVWYMDDGTLDNRSKYHFNSSIATYCFSFEECYLLSEVLKENFGLSVSVNQSTMRGKVYPRLYIKSESMNNFISIVKPFICPVFEYKI